jgi:G protein-coupled receptor Mth (Methuselah protein)
MGVPWTTEIITFMADSSFESALFTDIFNIISPIFIFIIFICKPSVWKMLKLKYPRLNPFFSTCEKIGSRIVHPKKSKRQPQASGEESQSLSNNITSSTNSANKTDYQSMVELKEIK